MTNREDHLRLLRQGNYPVPENVPGLLPAERHLLVKYGFWLQALAEGSLTPESADQERFVAVAGGREVSFSDHEKAWVKLRAAAQPVETDCPSRAGLSHDDESILRQVRSMLSRGEHASGFADSVVRQWEQSGQVSPKQVAALRSLVTQAEGRAAAPKVVGGGSRKPGSHRSNW